MELRVVSMMPWDAMGGYTYADKMQERRGEGVGGRLLASNDTHVAGEAFPSPPVEVHAWQWKAV